jgi:hypothetical protein
MFSGNVKCTKICACLPSISCTIVYQILSFNLIPKLKFIAFKIIIVANMNDIKLFGCDVQKIILKILLDIDPVEFGMNFDAHRMNPNIAKGAHGQITVY